MGYRGYLNKVGWEYKSIVLDFFSITYSIYVYFNLILWKTLEFEDFNYNYITLINLDILFHTFKN